MNMVRELGWPYFPGFSGTAQESLLNYTWPGNIRELRNVVERSLYRTEWTEEPIDTIRFNPFKSEYEHRFEELEKTPAELRQANVAPLHSLDVTALQTPLKDSVANLEKKMIDLAMRETQFNQAKAAKLLSLSYHQLRAYLKKHDLFKLYGRKSKIPD